MSIKHSKMKKLFMPFDNGTLQLKNHIIMAPMTRSRALGNLPNNLMATYYGQRAGAGLIVTEGTSQGYTDYPVSNSSKAIPTIQY
jgi:2,4-dienoyl-CoA reductase-like NADH-dependent reductase (Old Yellow Enzyme family)